MGLTIGLTGAVLTYVAPQLGLSAFNCPHCGAYAQQTFYGYLVGHQRPPGWGPPGDAGSMLSNDLDISVCSHCGDSALWKASALIYPVMVTAPKPGPEMPDDVAADFEEARQVANASPAAAAALLRRAVEKLVEHLDAKGNNLNQRIGDLVSRGMPPELQQALDYVRVTGNDHVHPGELVEGEPADTVNQLFTIVNEIVERMIVFPKRMSALYNGLPDTKLEQVRRRDGGD